MQKLAEEKYSLRKQMALDDAERNKLDNLKQEEKEQAEKEVMDSFAHSLFPYLLAHLFTS